MVIGGHGSQWLLMMYGDNWLVITICSWLIMVDPGL